MLLPLMSSGQEVVRANEAITVEPKGFKMYPNPAYGDEVYIATDSNGNKKITVFDVFGDIVLKDQIEENTLNISKLVPGVYVLQVMQDKKTMTRKLVIK